MPVRHSIVVAAALFTMLSCSVVKTTRINSLSAVSEDAISYFLPIGRLHLVVNHTKNNATTVTLEEVVVPDTTQQYKAQITNDPMSRDNIKITLSNGMLQQISSTTEDQSGVVAKNLAKTAKQVIQLAATFGVGGEGDEIDFHVDATFDPFADRDVQMINDKLELIGGSIDPLRCPTGDHGEVATDQDGLLYRPAYPYTFTVQFAGPTYVTPPAVKNADGSTTAAEPQPALVNGRYPAPAGIYSFAVNLPSKCSPILSLDVSRTAFGRNVTTVNFANGSLVDVNVDKDSEVAGFSQIPVDVTAELLTLPQDLLTLRYNNVSAQEKLVAEQKTLYDEQVQLIDSLKKLNEAQAAASATPVPSPTAEQTVPVASAPAQVQ